MNWDKNDELLIREHYFSMSNRALQTMFFPDKTIKSISLKAHYLGITDSRKPKNVVFLGDNPFILDTFEWAYVAGLFDGEGSLPKHKRCNFVVDIVNSTNRDVINWIHRKFVGSRLYQITKEPRKICWRVSLHKRNAIYWFMNEVEPYVIIKKDKITYWLDKFTKWYTPRKGR